MKTLLIILGLAFGLSSVVCAADDTLGTTTVFGGEYKDVEVVGDYAYVAATSELEILDISTPAEPLKVGSYYTSDDAHAVSVAGNYAYVASSYNGVLVIDITDPAVPELVASYDTSGGAKAV